MIITGRAVRLDDNVDTDIIIPTQYMTLPTLADMAHHAFEPIWPGFADFVREGDVIVAGRNFGSGSSREQAPEILKVLGISCVVAASFSRLFYRNALNNGLLVVESAELHSRVTTGTTLTIDLDRCVIKGTDGDVSFGRIPEELTRMVATGGLVAYWRQVNTAAS